MKKPSIKILVVVSVVALVAAAIITAVLLHSKKPHDDSENITSTTDKATVETTVENTTEENITETDTKKENTTIPVTLEEDVYEHDAEIYRTYFENGGYDDILEKYEIINDGFWKDIVICDFNDDNVYEAFVRCGNAIEYYGGLLTIEDGSVKRIWSYDDFIINAHIGSVTVKRDEVDSELVICTYWESEPGGYVLNNTYEIYTFDGSTVSLKTKYEKHAYALTENEYAANNENIEKIKSETSLYKVDDDAFTCYQIDGTYVSEADYNEIIDRYKNQDFESL